MVKFKATMGFWALAVILFLVTCVVSLQTMGQNIVQNIKMVEPYNSPADNEIRELKIGDYVPNIEFKNVLNYKSRKAKLSDFKGKFLILDLWSASCASCLVGFPKLEELQSEFKDKLQILLVNPHDRKYEPEHKVNAILQNIKKRTGFYPSVPIPLYDTILNLLFPHESIPLQVIIDPGGKVVAIASPRDVTREVIKNLLDGKSVPIPLKDDRKFDVNKPLLIDGNGGTTESYIFRSMFSGYQGGLDSHNGVRMNGDNLITGYFIINRTLFSIIEEAYLEKFIRFNSATRIFEVSSKDRFKKEFDPSNTYCYDLIVPATSIVEFNSRKFLQTDLQRVFSITVKEEKRKMNCWILRTTKAISLYYAKNSETHFELSKNDIKKFIRNYPIYQVVQMLQPFVDAPLILESELRDQKIDIDFPDNYDLTADRNLMAILQRIGFEISFEERELDVLVISDRSR